MRTSPGPIPRERSSLNRNGMLILALSICGCERNGGSERLAPTLEAPPTPSAPTPSAPTPSGSKVDEVEPERCVPLSDERRTFWRSVLPPVVDYNRSRCGLREIDNWEWTRCGEHTYFVYASPEATRILAVYDAGGQLVGVHGQLIRGHRVCEGPKPSGPCSVFTCGRGPPGGSGGNGRGGGKG